MTEEEFYGTAWPDLKAAEKLLLNLIARYEAAGEEAGKDRGEHHWKPVAYCNSRIKTPESMMEKLRRRGLPETAQAALTGVQDAVGVRAITSFIDDVYQLAAWLKAQPELTVLEEKDYIASPKENGYRSLHMIVCINEGEAAGVRAEIQLRTIALDFWASLEHQLKYKQNIRNEALIRSELKACADEITSLDLSMQTIKDLICE